jgi:hypothetical protein
MFFEYLVDAKKYSEDCSAFHHAIYGYLIQSNKEDAETLYQGLKNKNPQMNTFWHLLNIRMLLALYFVVHMQQQY